MSMRFLFVLSLVALCLGDFPETITIQADSCSWWNQGGSLVLDHNETISWKRNCATISDTTTFTAPEFTTKISNHPSYSSIVYLSNDANEDLHGCVLTVNYIPDPSYADDVANGVFFYPFNNQDLDDSDDDNSDADDDDGTSGDDDGTSGDDDGTSGDDAGSSGGDAGGSGGDDAVRRKYSRNSSLTRYNQNSNNFLTAYCNDRLLNTSAFDMTSKKFYVYQNSSTLIATVYNQAPHNASSFANMCSKGSYVIEFEPNVNDTFTKLVVAHLVFVKSIQEVQQTVSGCNMLFGFLVIGVPIIGVVAIAGGLAIAWRCPPRTWGICRRHHHHHGHHHHYSQLN